MGCCLSKTSGSHPTFSRFSPAGKHPPPPSPDEGLSAEENGADGGSPPEKDASEKERFTSYYGGSAEEAELRVLKRGIVKFNVKPREVRGSPRRAARVPPARRAAPAPPRPPSPPRAHSPHRRAWPSWCRTGCCGRSRARWRPS